MSRMRTPLCRGPRAVPVPAWALSRFGQFGQMMHPQDELPVRRAAEYAARHGYGKLVAFLAARTGDVAAAEDALADAFAAALARRAARGGPRAPEGLFFAAA